VTHFPTKGKKQQQENAKKSSQNVKPEEDAVSSSKDEVARPTSTSQLMQRDIARMTEQKIDAIEAAIAKDYLKASVTPPSVSPSSPSVQLFHAEDPSLEYLGEKSPDGDSRDFPPTIFRFTKESLLFADDDE